MMSENIFLPTICQLYQVDYSTFYSEDGIIWPTIHAIHKVIKLAYPTTDPNDPDFDTDELQHKTLVHLAMDFLLA